MVEAMFQATSRALKAADLVRKLQLFAKEAGVEPSADQTSFGEYSLTWGERWATDAHRRGLLKGAGVLAGNDEIALGILQTARQLGVRVPEDLRIIGFDDTRLASLVRPSLSTVRVPLTDVGAAAVRSLVERIGSPDKKAGVTSLATKLIVRESSGGNGK